MLYLANVPFTLIPFYYRLLYHVESLLYVHASRIIQIIHQHNLCYKIQYYMHHYNMQVL